MMISLSLLPSGYVYSIAEKSLDHNDFMQNELDRGTFLIVHEGIAVSARDQATHTLKLEIMTEYLLEDDSNEILLNDDLALGHLSLDDVEGLYFLEFSTLKISKDLTTITFRGSNWQADETGHDPKQTSLRESSATMITVSGRIAYTEPINFAKDSLSSNIVEKSQIQITIKYDIGEIIKLGLKESTNSAISTNIIPTLSQEDGKSFIIQTANGDTFTIFATDPETIRLLTDNYLGLNNMFVIGRLGIGDGGFNSPWSWHVDREQVTMTEFAIELCDGTPSELERNLPYWLFQVELFCPWSSRVVHLAD